MANPFDLPSDDPFTAALTHARAGYAGKSRAALMDKPEPNADVQSLDLDNPSAFESILKTVGLGGYGVRNILKGNIEGAGRNLVDLISSPLRAVLPGDQSSWELSRPEDLPEFSDLTGGMEPGLAKAAVDVLGGIVTDPLSFLGVGEFSAAAKAAKAANAAVKVARASGDVAKLAEAAKAAEVANTALKASRAAGETKTALGVGLPFMPPVGEIPGSAAGLTGLGTLGGKAVGAGANLIRKAGGGVALDSLTKRAPAVWSDVKGIFGAQKPTDEIARNIQESQALGASTGMPAAEKATAVNAAFAPDIQEKAHLLVEDIAKNSQGWHESIGVKAPEMFGTAADQAALIDQRLAQMPWDDTTKAAVREAAISNADQYGRHYQQLVNAGVMERPAEVAEGLHPLDYIPRAGDLLHPLDYIPRAGDLKLLDEGLTPDQLATPLANMLKSRTLTEQGQLAEHLNTPGVSLDHDLGVLGANYSRKLGRSVQAAELAKRTLGPFVPGVEGAADKGFKSLLDTGTRQRMNGTIQALRDAGDHDSANVLNVAFNGLPTPTDFWRALSKINAPFKKAATAGVVIPRIKFIAGNVASNVMQAIQQGPEGRKIALSQLMSLPKVIAGSFADGFKTLGMPLADSRLDEIVTAARASDGTRAGMLAMIKDPTVRLAVEHGVLDNGFISAEKLASDFATKGDPRKASNWINWTQDVAKGSEQRMRFGAFEQLIANGETPQDATKVVDEMLFNYGYSSAGNRNARQIIPFGQYMFKAAPQSAKFLAEKPAAAVGLNALYSQNNPNEHPLPPWTNGNVNLPLGLGPTGEQQYLTNFRMPFETLAKIPNPSGSLGNLLADTRSDVVGQVSPLFKTGLAAFGGNDPWSGQAFMSNDRSPAALEALGVERGGALARDYNALAGTGAIQPVVSIVNTLSDLLDKRQSMPIAALNSLTGLKIISVDEARAMQQIIEDTIKRDPSIKGSLSYYQLAQTSDGQALLQRLKEVKKILKTQKATSK